MLLPPSTFEYNQAIANRCCSIVEQFDTEQLMRLPERINL
jgi:hypothetical protein